MSILSYNGGAVVAMAGEKCVAIASDLRYGRELQTISTDFPKGKIKNLDLFYKTKYFLFNRFLK